MSKFTVVSMALIAASIALSSAITPEEKAAIKAQATPFIKACEEELNISKEDVLAAIKNKNIDGLDSCFYDCFFKKIGFINDAGFFAGDVAEEKNKKFVSGAEDLEKLSNIVKTCSAVNDQPAKGCDRAKLLLSCFIKEKSVFSPFA